MDAEEARICAEVGKRHLDCTEGAISRYTDIYVVILVHRLCKLNGICYGSDGSALAPSHQNVAPRHVWTSSSRCNAQLRENYRDAGLRRRFWCRHFGTSIALSCGAGGGVRRKAWVPTAVNVAPRPPTPPYDHS